MRRKPFERASHSIWRVRYKYYEEDHMRPLVDKRAMWDSAPWLVQVVCCNGLTMMGFNTNSVEAEGQCKRL